MPSLQFVTLDVFTTSRFEGNPLAVCLVPAGQDPPTETLLQIAKEFNLSETVFLYDPQGGVSAPEVPQWRVRIFMVGSELPFAGHPTIGTASFACGTLAEGAKKARLLCNAGPIEIDYADGAAKAAIPHNVHVHTEAKFSRHQVETLQPGLKGKEIDTLDVVSPVKGMNFVCARLPDLQTLGFVETSGFKPNPQLDREWNVGFKGSVFYVLTSNSSPQDGFAVQNVQMRMIEGTLEDPATGSAACGLGAYLSLTGDNRRVKYQILQGVELGRRSEIGVSVTLTENLKAVETIELSGAAVKVMSGEVEYE